MKIFPSFPPKLEGRELDQSFKTSLNIRVQFSFQKKQQHTTFDECRTTCDESQGNIWRVIRRRVIRQHLTSYKTIFYESQDNISRSTRQHLTSHNTFVTRQRFYYLRLMKLCMHTETNFILSHKTTKSFKISDHLIVFFLFLTFV